VTYALADDAAAEPAVSVVVPVHNMADHVAGTVASLAQQSSKDFEIIVVDDGSTDDTPRLVAQAAARYDLVRLQVVQVPHGGVSVARNFGAALATGTYIIFLDGDDRVAPDLVRTVAGVPAEPDLICWGWDTVDQERSVVRGYFDIHPRLSDRVTGVEALRRRLVARTMRTWTASVAYRRQFVVSHDLRFTDGCACGEDLEFAYLALAHAETVQFVDRVLSTYVRRPGSASSRSDVRRFDSVGALERTYAQLASHAAAEVREMAEVIPLNRIARNYFHTLESCLRGRAGSRPVSLVREVDRKYPGLTERVRALLRERLRRQLPTGWDHRLFLVSPWLWWSYRQSIRLLDQRLPASWRSTSARSMTRTANRLRQDVPRTSTAGRRPAGAAARRARHGRQG
jgi:glycosyltransferase involved in cell wall biosynthesis